MDTAATDAFRGMNYELAEAIAPSWERRRDDIERISEPVRAWLLQELGARPGDTVLELAAGVGDTGFDAAAAVGGEGLLISSDFSPSMLEAARRRGAERGVANVDYRVIDAERMELEADSVDRVLCRFGYMLMADPATALAETRRVLRPGGRLAFAVWGAPEKNPFFTAVAMALVQQGHMAPPDPTGPGLFSMASPDRTTALLRDAGFGDGRVEEVPVRFEVAGGADEYLAMVADTAGSLAMLVRGLSDDARTAVTSAAGSALERFAGPDGYTVPGVALCAVAS